MFPKIIFSFRFILAQVRQKFPVFYYGLFLGLFSPAAMTTPLNPTGAEVIVALNCDDRHRNRLHEETLNLERVEPDHRIHANDNKTKQTVLTPSDVVLGVAARSHSTAIVCESDFIKALDLIIANARTVHFNPFHAGMSFRAIKCYGAPLISSAPIFPILSKPTANWMSSCNSNNADNGNITKVVKYGSDLSGCTSVSIPASSTALWKSHSVVSCKVSNLLSKTQDGKCLSV